MDEVESDGFSIRFSSEETMVKEEEEEDPDISMELEIDEENERDNLTRKQKLKKISSARHETPFASRLMKQKNVPIIRLWSRPYVCIRQMFKIQGAS